MLQHTDVLDTENTNISGDDRTLPPCEEHKLNYPAVGGAAIPTHDGSMDSIDNKHGKSG